MYPCIINIASIATAFKRNNSASLSRRFMYYNTAILNALLNGRLTAYNLQIYYCTNPKLGRNLPQKLTYYYVKKRSKEI